MGKIINPGQLIDIVEYLEEGSKQIIWKFRRDRNEIKHGARLIVRPGQAAILVHRGQLADVFLPGHYVLKTKNLPILSTLLAAPFGFNSPIKSDVYFVDTTQFLGMKWETGAPILRRDPEMGIVRISAAGSYAFQITNPRLFLETVFGARKSDTTEEVSAYLSSFIGEAVSQCIGEIQVSVLDLAMNFRNMSQEVTRYADEKAGKLGITISEATIEHVRLPQEVEKLIDEQSGIGLASRNMDSFMQYQTARAMRDAAKQNGGLAGIGAGYVFSQQLAQTIADRKPSVRDSAPRGSGYASGAPQPPVQPQAYPAPADPEPAPAPYAERRMRPAPPPTPARPVPSPAPRQSAPPALPDMVIPPLINLLAKGQKTPLLSSGAPVRQLKACFGWNIRDSRCDIDASAFLLEAGDRVPGDDWFVFYGQETSPDQSVAFGADGSGKDREVFRIDFSRLDPRIRKIVFVMTIHEALEKRLNFSMIKDAYVRLLDAATNRELMSYRLEEFYENVTSMTIGELYLHNGQWKFNPVGNGVRQDLAGQCAIYGVNLE